MKIKLHKLAKTTPALREEIRKSSLSGAELARKHSLSLDTIYKWKKREDVRDLPHARHNLGSKISELEEEIIKELRGKLGLSIDDITEVMRRCIREDISRSGIYRAIKRCGVALRPKEASEATAQRVYAFEEVSECGYIHMDVKYLTKLAGKRSYLYAAIDRFSRYVYTEVLYDLEPKTASGFIERFIEHFPHKVKKIITDNGFEWTDRCSGGVKEKATGNHPVDVMCGKNEIKHQLTRIRRPQTNGMIERFNRRINEAIALKAKIANNSGRNSFNSHEERNEFIYNFVNSYNNTRLRCLDYQAPLSLLTGNLKKYNTFAGMTSYLRHYLIWKSKNMSPKFMKFYERYIIVIGTVGNFMFYVQAHKIFTCKSAASVSLPAFTISAVALSSWLLYGMLIKNTPIIIANIVGFIGALLVLVTILMY